tara:strand:- start:198 stop:521 length:324 start_codon:yes stop_codon:yes gene_type:complete
MSKKKEVTAVVVRTYCTRGDMVGTSRPDGGHITAVSEDDDKYIEQGAELVTAMLVGHPIPDSKVTILAARWANIVAAVDLRCLGETGARTEAAMSAIDPTAFDSLDG